MPAPRLQYPAVRRASGEWDLRRAGAIHTMARQPAHIEPTPIDLASEGGDLPTEALPVDVLLIAIAAEVEARAATPVTDLCSDHTVAALELYCQVGHRCPGLDGAARDIMQPLAPRVLRDAATARDLMRGDPATPGLEAQYYFLLSELSNLATIFVTTNPETHETPDPRDDHAPLYESVCEEIREIMAASQLARPAWRLVRLSYAAARCRPPPRRPPRSALADNNEYYF